MLYFTSAQGRSIYFLARTMLPGSRCIDALWPMNLTQRVDASPLLPSPEPQEHEEQPRTPRNQAAVDDQLLSGEAFGSGTPFGTPFGTPALMAWMENHPSAAKRALDSPLLFGSPSQLLHQVAQPPPPPQQLPLPQQQQPQLLIDPLQLPIQQLPVVVRGVDDVLQFYQSGTHPSILDAGDAPEPLMLRTASVAQPRANLYTYSVDFHRAKLLLAANYCMSDQFDNGTLFKLLGSSAEDLHKPFMRSLVRQTLDGFNVLLPFEDPGQPMADFYKDNMAGSLVLISIDDPGAGCLLALGTFVGDAMYANTAEAATRYQAAHDDFFSGVDSNAILAPVYITTTLLRDEPVNVQTLLAEAPDLQHKRADIAALIGTHSANLCLPPPLCLLLPELQIAFKAPMADHGTRADHENLICRAFWNLCIHEARVRPDRVIMPKSGDDDRVAAVMQLDNALHHGVGGQMPPPKKRCKSPRPSTCNKKHAIKNLMQLAASRIQTFMAHEFNAEHRALSSLL